MNSELIKQLGKAASVAALEIYRKRMETELAGDVLYSDIYDQKFVELIVAECNNQIKHHFGVE